MSALLGGWVKRWCCCGDEGWGESVVMNYWCGHWPQCLRVPIQLAFGLAFGFSRLRALNPCALDIPVDIPFKYAHQAKYPCLL